VRLARTGAADFFAGAVRFAATFFTAAVFFAGAEPLATTEGRRGAVDFFGGAAFFARGATFFTLATRFGRAVFITDVPAVFFTVLFFAPTAAFFALVVDFVRAVAPFLATVPFFGAAFFTPALAAFLTGLAVLRFAAGFAVAREGLATAFRDAVVVFFPLPAAADVFRSAGRFTADLFAADRLLGFFLAMTW